MKVQLVRTRAVSLDLVLTSWVDLDKITDELEREATVGIIHNCT